MSIDLALFTTDPETALEAKSAGINRVVVDWETAGKASRQSGYSTEINNDCPDHVREIAGRLSIPVLVRIDHVDQSQVDRDIEVAIDCGAESIMFPMARTLSQVERFVDQIAGRARSVVQIETQDLVERIDDLSQIGWDSVYIGLNDLMISRKANWLWTPVLDGTVDRIFESLTGRQVGFGGVTVIGGGSPIPFPLLFAEMARLGCSMSFLRRSFNKEIVGRDMVKEITAIRALWDALVNRDEEAVARDRESLTELLHRIDPGSNSLTIARKARDD